MRLVQALNWPFGLISTRGWWMPAVGDGDDLTLISHKTAVTNSSPPTITPVPERVSKSSYRSLLPQPTGLVIL
ncbi:MAG: hypothetical protein M3083_13745 [Actinomycetota bacterium]|nr:hypothetical protein [Actinomycetota bacterium]